MATSEPKQSKQEAVEQVRQWLAIAHTESEGSEHKASRIDGMGSGSSAGNVMNHVVPIGVEL